jgi:hypothetical protein
MQPIVEGSVLFHYTERALYFYHQCQGYRSEDEYFFKEKYTGST